MSERIRERLHDQDNITSRGERFRRSYQTGEYIDEHTTIPGITPVAYKRKSADELRRDFMRRMKQCNVVKNTKK